MKKTNKTIVKEFIKNNGLVFDGSGSELNGHCTTLAGFICHIVNSRTEGYEIIDELKLPTDAYIELHRVFEFAYSNHYGDFWDTPQARELYKF